MNDGTIIITVFTARKILTQKEVLQQSVMCIMSVCGKMKLKSENVGKAQKTDIRSFFLPLLSQRIKMLK